MANHEAEFEQMAINTVRFLAVDAVEKAKSGHPGMPMGAAPLAYALWTKYLRHNPRNPRWWNRDRFVLSAGHGSMLLYSLLFLTGYDLSLEDIKQFRQWGSKTPGHPEFGHTPGVETTTGPLGQGLANAVGMAMGERFAAARFNRPGFLLADHFTYVIAGDGDLMEGISHEAASLAGHLGLGRLICLYDANDISIEGNISIAFTEDVGRRFEAYNWQVETVADGNDVAAIVAAIGRARAEEEKPSLIIVRTHIGYGSPNRQDSSAAHGEPLGAKEVALTKERLGWPQEPEFLVPENILKHFRQAVVAGGVWEAQWQQQFEGYEQTYPELTAEWRQWMSKKVPAVTGGESHVFPVDEKGMATRVAAGLALNQLAKALPNLLGGSADLAPSTKTLLEGADDFTAGNYAGRNIHFGVREHAMGGILNGLALYGGLIPFGATFLIFSDYMRPAIRLAALMKLKVIYVFTHDSIGLGEDGPTHQPIEQLAALRAIPGLTVIRPADANETAEAWRCAIETPGPVALILSRQNVPTLDRTVYAPAEGLGRGAYILQPAPGNRPELVLIASGSEVHTCLAAAARLAETNIAVQVVSMPSWQLFEEQTDQYRQSVLPAGVPRLVVEAGSSQGWHKYSGDAGRIVTIDRFGASAPYADLVREFGLTAGAVVQQALSLLVDNQKK
ncbi:MAG: transketolase [Negativicutes bacterium]|nr:transketolase [Negativicutes bacterium]